MSNATALTRQGKVAQATLAIQETLGNYTSSSATQNTRRPAASPPFTVQARKLFDASALRKRFHSQPGAPRSATDLSGKASSPSRQTLHENPLRQSDEQTGVSTGDFTYEGLIVPYRLYIPPGTSDSPIPLLVLLHGCTQDAEDFATGTTMDAVAREHSVAVLYPSQTARGNVNKCWNWFEPAHQHRGSGEPAALGALTQKISIEQNIDQQRVFVAGMSAGGAMAVILGEQYPELFAAVGVHSGLPSGVASNVMQAMGAMKGSSDGPLHVSSSSLNREVAHVPSSRVQPHIVFHGAQDRTVDAANARIIVTNCVQRASEFDAQITSECSQSGSGNAGVTVTTYRNSEQRIICENWLLTSAGHQWSGGNPAGSHTAARGPNASAEMVRFFLHAVQVTTV